MNKVRLWIADWLSGRARIAELNNTVADLRRVADAAEYRAQRCERMAHAVTRAAIGRVNDRRDEVVALQRRLAASARDLERLTRALSAADAAEYNTAARRALQRELERLEPSSRPRMSRARLAVVR